MGAKILLGAMLASSVLAVAWGARDRGPAPPPEVPSHPPETPWLGKQAAAEIVAADGNLGPLFASLTLGGLAPTPEERTRIAAFARENRVSIDLQVDDDQLVAIRFEVTYGGCCGYEGADVLALRANRPTRGGGCFGTAPYWLNDWSVVYDDGTHLRARVDRNRVVFRWEHELTTHEMIDRAEAALGADTGRLARSAGERWSTLAYGIYGLEQPYHQGQWEAALQSPFGLTLTAESGRVSEVTFVIHATTAPVDQLLRRRWGRPVIHDDVWTWREAGRTIEARPIGEYATITMRGRSV